jgi:hypothetical protein
VKATKKAARLDPNKVVNVGFEYLALNRFDEARSIFEQGLTRRPDEEVLHIGMHIIASLRVPRFLRPLERRRPEHPRPERSQGGVCEVRAEQRVVQEG